MRTMSAAKIYRVFAAVSLMLSVACLMMATNLSSSDFRAPASGVIGANASWIAYFFGGLSIFVALIGPLRVGLSAAMIPLQIKQMLRVLGFCLLAGGLGALLSTGASPSWVAPLGWFVMSGAAGVCAVLAFYRLSTQLPQTLTVHEMLVTIKSASLFGAQSETVVDREYRRWTGGRTEGVTVGQGAVDGVVHRLDGGEEKLSDYFSDGSLLVVNFASYTCPIHRKRLDDLEAVMQKRQSSKVRFLTVYTAEAHPDDGWRLDGQFKNDAEYNGNEEDFCFLQPQTLQERLKMAHWLVDKKKLEMSLVVDSMQNTLLQAYNTWPIRLYVFKGDRVIYEGKQGPFGYDPLHLDAFLASTTL